MSISSSLRGIGGVAAVSLALAGVHARPAPPAPLRESAVVLTPSEEQAVAEFEARLEDYLVLHHKLGATLPRLPKRATSEQVNRNQAAFAALIRTARANAKQGEFFTPVMQALVARTLKTILGGPDGATVRASIMNENPGVPALRVNDGYPSTAPLSPMPPQLLKALPKLGEDVEYRFIGERLALMDARAHNVIDFTEDVLP